VRLAGPSAAELREVMTGPAVEAGFPPADGLADLVLAELDIAPDAPSSPPGALALVAAALAATWECAVADGSAQVTIAHYRAASGVYGAVERAAEQAYGALSPAQAALVRPMLLRLVRVRGTHGDADSVRRRIRRFGLTYGLGPDETVATDAVVEALVAARVLTAGEGTLELAHDVVLRAWPRLADWVREDREQRPARGMITEAARLWHDTGRDEGALLAGRRLDEALAFTEGPAGAADLYPLERELVAASREHRRVGEVRHVRGLQVAVGVLAVLLVVALVVAVLG
jgi:hypothetical protein